MFNFLKNNLVSMGPNILKDDSNFYLKMFGKFSINFIVLINQFEPRKKIPFIKEGSRTIIFNMVLNSLNKRTMFKNMINVFTILIVKIAHVCNF